MPIFGTMEAYEQSDPVNPFQGQKVKVTMPIRANTVNAPYLLTDRPTTSNLVDGWNTKTHTTNNRHDLQDNGPGHRYINSHVAIAT